MHNNICDRLLSIKGPDYIKMHFTSMLKNKEKISSMPS